MAALCPVCRCTEHNDLVEPVITSCGHLFCWTCLYQSVKEAPNQDFSCPSCRLIITAVISDHSRGSSRSDREQLESRIPWRPGQGVFPFDFQFGMDAGEGLDRDPPAEEEEQESSPTSQPSRRSVRERRVNSRLGGYADLRGLAFQPLLESTRVTGESVLETGDRESIIDGDSQEDQQFVTSGDESSELPEPELRFVHYQAREAIAEDLEEEARRQFEAENALRESVVIAKDHEESVGSQDIEEAGQTQGRVQEGRVEQTQSEQEDDDNVLDNDYEGEREEEEEEENINTRFKKRDIVLGTQLSHIEVTLLHTRIVIREDNVKIDVINYRTVARSIKDSYPLSFPGKGLENIARLAKSIVMKAKRDFENSKAIIPKILRAGNERETRMEETVSVILRISSAAPLTVRRNRNRGIARRPLIEGRPTLLGPGVGAIAPDASSLESASSSATSANSRARTGPPQSQSSQDDDVTEEYVRERRLRQEQGSHIREHSLGQIRSRRINNNTRLGAQIDSINTSIQSLNNTRQSGTQVNDIVNDSNRRAEERVVSRQERAVIRQDDLRAREEERMENRRMNLLLVAAVTKDTELREQGAVTGKLKVYKPIPEPSGEQDDVSQEFPITLNLTNIGKLKEDLMAFLGSDRDIAGVVIKLKNGDKTIITSAQMVTFEQCYLEVITKKNRQFLLITEK